MSGNPIFQRLNDGWNAQPNAPFPKVETVGSDIILRFNLNCYAYEGYSEEDSGILRFKNCKKFRLGGTNDEGWYLGQCRYSKIAQKWGEFYEIIGVDPQQDKPTDWQILNSSAKGSRHFLFYFRDETFECFADDWMKEPSEENALYRRAING